ncbi:MAG: hypothetical protein ABSF32_07625 [Ignavibacteria bacterium]
MNYYIYKLFSAAAKIFLTMFLVLLTYALINSALDIYNNFAYDKAILKDSPYGYVPLLQDPKNYGSGSSDILSGQFVYVVDWLSAYNNKIAFAKVRSKLKEGYINKELLVETNTNVKPVISVILLTFIFIYTFKKIFNKLHSKLLLNQIVHSKNQSYIKEIYS